MQKNHYNSSFQHKKFPIILVCDNVSKAPNIGSLFRTAEAFGVEKLIFCGKNIPMGKRMTKTSRTTEKFVAYELHENVLDVVNNLKSQQYLIVSLEITNNSLPIDKYLFPPQPIALIIGDENHGISNDILEESDVVLHIDMFGHNSSMNVVQATAIMLYEITRQLR
jgi:tRNA G18 (ribose-2'-O)-methylase SpoU